MNIKTACPVVRMAGINQAVTKEKQLWYYLPAGKAGNDKCNCVYGDVLGII